MARLQSRRAITRGGPGDGEIAGLAGETCSETRIPGGRNDGFLGMVGKAD